MCHALENNIERQAEVDQAADFRNPDLSQLFDRCLAAGPEVTFAVVNGISNNRMLRMDLEETRQLLGYAPNDDAFEDWSQRA